MKIKIYFAFLNEGFNKWIGLPGSRELLKDLQERDIAYDAVECGDQASDCIVADISSYITEDCRKQNVFGIILSDHRRLIRKLGSHAFDHLLCVGWECALARNCETQPFGFFEGADYVLESVEGIDGSYFENLYKRCMGVPLIIAETERLLIRESIAEDFDDLFQMQTGEPSFVFNRPLSDDKEWEREQFLAYINKCYRFYECGLWTVLLKENGSIVGRCGLLPEAVTEKLPANIPAGSLPIGYLIGKEYRRCGYAAEACRAVMKYAQDMLDVQTIYAYIDPENSVSRIFADRMEIPVIRTEKTI